MIYNKKGKLIISLEEKLKIKNYLSNFYEIKYISVGIGMTFDEWLDDIDNEIFDKKYFLSVNGIEDLHFIYFDGYKFENINIKNSEIELKKETPPNITYSLEEINYIIENRNKK